MSEKSVRSSSEGDRLKLSLDEAKQYYAYDDKFTAIAQEANKANDEGNRRDALRAMAALEDEVRTASSQFGMSDEQVAFALNKYHTIAGLGEDNPEGLSPYEQMLREKYLSRKFDEADEQKDDRSPADSDESNPEDLTPYEQMLRDKYLGDKFDEVEERERKQAEELRQLEKLVADARERFATAKIAVETSFFQKYFGGEKKQKELTEAAEQLKTLELTLAHTKLKSDIEDVKGRAEEDDEAAEVQQQAIAQLMAAHVFEQRRLAEELTTEKFDEMLDSRSGVKKFGAKIGRWFSRGGKVAQWLKAGGTGVVAGAGVAFAAGGFPITTVVGMASSAMVGGAVKQSVLEEQRNAVWVPKDDEEKVKAWQEHLTKVGLSSETGEGVDMLQRMIAVGYDESVKDSRYLQEDMRKRVRGAMGKYAAGYALGGIAGGLVRNFLMPGAETAQAMGDVTNSADMPQHTGDISQGATDTPPAPVERVSVPPVESTSPAIDYTGKYPWDVAAEMFGSEQAMDRLYEMASKAAEAGYDVQWHGDGVTQWVEINGQSGTKEVMDILLQYK